MTKVRRVAWAWCAALLAVLLAVQPVLAAPPAQRAEFNCTGGVCRFELELGPAANLPGATGFWLEVADSALRLLPGEPRVLVEDDVVLSLPMGSLTLPDARLTLELGPERQVTTLRGTARLPVPAFGPFAGMSWLTAMYVDVGYDLGANLDKPAAALATDRHYLFFDLTAASGDQRATLIVDPLLSSIYADGALTLRSTGSLAELRQALDPSGALAWMPDDLLLPQTFTLGWTGRIGGAVPNSLVLTADYRVGFGLAGEWLAVDGKLLEAQGRMTLLGDGVWLAGQARSIFDRGPLREGENVAQLFIPFRRNGDTTPATVSVASAAATGSDSETGSD
jgi:hypothetical protein